MATFCFHFKVVGAGSFPPSAYLEVEATVTQNLIHFSFCLFQIQYKTGYL